jgi:hypothetical protein
VPRELQVQRANKVKVYWGTRTALFENKLEREG